MALSTPPPPPDPTSSTTTTTTRPPVFPPNPRHPPPPPPPPTHHYPLPYYPPPPHPHLINSRHPSNPTNNPNYPNPTTTTTTTTTTLYPVASSGRGFLPNHPHSYPRHSRPVIGVSYPRPVFGYHHPDPGSISGFGYVTGGSRSVTNLQQQHPVMPGVIKGVPVSASASSHPQHKIAPSSSSVSDCNGHKETRERGRDDSFVIIRDRKVRVSENASVYALCRSWLQNGIPEESQPVHMDAARSLPRPLPLPTQDNLSPAKKDDPKEEQEEEESVDNLTSEQLLQTHIKRAKRVRSRLREERLQRIARYKTRLGLLLPLMVEQQMRNDSASGN